MQLIVSYCKNTAANTKEPYDIKVYDPVENTEKRSYYDLV